MRKIERYTAEQYTHTYAGNANFMTTSIRDYTAWRLIIHYDDGNMYVVKDKLTETDAAAMAFAGNESLKEETV